MNNTNQLVQSAIELVRIGEALAQARDTLASMVEAGIPYDSEVMVNALSLCRSLEAQWKFAEQQHLLLRHSIQP